MDSSHALPDQENRTNTTQLNIDWYTSAEVYILEQQILFTQMPHYVGHELMVPDSGDFHVLNWLDRAKTLVNQQGEISLISNVCRHRQAIMLNGRGNVSHVVCPLHRWTYDLKGQLIGAPKFEQNPCLHLQQTPLQNWQGLLFEASTLQSSNDISLILNQFNRKSAFDFSDYVYHQSQVTHYAFNWKTFIEVYLEDYHVNPFHSGLDQFVNCDMLEWQFSEHFSVQTVGYKTPPVNNATPAYAKWHQAANAYNGELKPAHGAIWFVLYPFLMLEWYPNVLVISHLIPTGVDSCTNVVEFYYPEEIALFEPEYMAAHQAAYNETAREDEEICQRMHDGRKALANLNKNEYGPYQSPLESGLAHFHQWYRQQMAAHLPVDNHI